MNNTDPTAYLTEKLAAAAQAVLNAVVAEAANSDADVRKSATLKEATRILTNVVSGAAAVRGSSAQLANDPRGDSSTAFKAHRIATLAQMIAQDLEQVRELLAPDGNSRALTALNVAAEAASASLSSIELTYGISATGSPPQRDPYDNALAFWREGGMTPADVASGIATRAAEIAAAVPDKFTERSPADPALRRKIELRILVLGEWRSCGGTPADGRTADEILNWCLARTDDCPLGPNWEGLTDTAQAAASV